MYKYFLYLFFLKICIKKNVKKLRLMSNQLRVGELSDP